MIKPLDKWGYREYNNSTSARDTMDKIDEIIDAVNKLEGHFHHYALQGKDNMWETTAPVYALQNAKSEEEKFYDGEHYKDQPEDELQKQVKAEKEVRKSLTNHIERLERGLDWANKISADYLKLIRETYDLATWAAYPRDAAMDKIADKLKPLAEDK